MKQRILQLLVILVGALLFSSMTRAQDATEIMKKAHLALYYPANDAQMDVQMKLIDKKGNERVREFTMLRLDEQDGGDQKYYTYFRKPADVARISFMVYKSNAGNDQRWIYVPSVDLVKPIAADDKNSSFVGSDFTYEDVSGRHWTEDAHKLLREDQLDGKDVYVIESIPVKPYKGFAKKITYVDKTNFMPLKEEYFDDKGAMTRIFRADKIADVDGFPTVTERSMENVKKGTKTIVAFVDTKYNVGLTDDIFAERYLKNPPRDFIK